MRPKVKNRPAGAGESAPDVKSVMRHDVTNPTASASAASRLRMRAKQPVASPSIHALHHVPREDQA